MEETANTEEKKSFNPLLGIVVVIILAVVGWAIWSGTQQAQNSGQIAVTPTTSTATQPTSMQEPSTTSASGSVNGQTVAVAVEGGNYYFKPNTITVKKGEKVKLTFTDAQGMHDFNIDELGVKTDVIKDGETATVEFTPSKVGTFEFYCSVGEHRQMGMKGTLVVE